MRVLGREGEDALKFGYLLMTVVQAILLFGSEMWVVTPHIGKNLGGFHHQVFRQITGKKPQ